MMNSDVTRSRTWQRLKKLAETPYDLTGGGLARDGRISSMVCRTAGLRLYYASQRIDQTVLEAFQDYADEHRLVDRFKEMRRGSVINRIDGWESENRRVLHTS